MTTHKIPLESILPKGKITVDTDNDLRKTVCAINSDIFISVNNNLGEI